MAEIILYGWNKNAKTVIEHRSLIIAKDGKSKIATEHDFLIVDTKQLNLDEKNEWDFEIKSHQDLDRSFYL